MSGTRGADGAIFERVPMSRRDLLRLGVGVAAAPALSRLAACAPVGDPPPAGVRWLFTSGADLDLGQGSWCWYSSPRTVVDGDQLYAGSVVTGTGTAQDGEIVVHKVDLAKRRIAARTVVGHAVQPDDHANPSVSLPNGPGGGVQVAWAPHTRRPEDGYVYAGMLGDELQPITEQMDGTAYAAAERVAGQRWILTRRVLVERSWSLLRYRPEGWENLGQVTTAVPSAEEAEPRPYHVVASSGSHMHLFVSTSNPSQQPFSSVYHGTVNPDLQVRRTDGRVVGTVGSSPPPITALTKVWDGHRSGGRDGRGWPVAANWAKGRPNVIISTRDTYGSPAMKLPGALSQLRYVWARRRLDNTWNVEHLAWAGSELYPAQPDYSGLAALDPVDPYRVVVSTNVHPRSGKPLRSSSDGRVHWELFEGYRSTTRWAWTPITSNSTADNLRPSIAVGGGHRALTWLRGNYPHYTTADTRLVMRAS